MTSIGESIYSDLVARGADRSRARSFAEVKDAEAANLVAEARRRRTPLGRFLRFRAKSPVAAGLLAGASVNLLVLAIVAAAFIIFES